MGSAEGGQASDALHIGLLDNGALLPSELRTFTIFHFMNAFY